MADRMEFPNTMKEFIDSYSFKDREEIYTNGAELIQVFRVEQAIEHYEKEIRAKAIDEFAEKVCDRVSEWSERCTFPKGVTCDILTLDCVTDVVFEVAEQLKGGAE